MTEDGQDLLNRSTLVAAQPWLAAAARDELTDFVRSEAEAADAPPTPPPLSATKAFGLLPPSRPSTAPKLLE